MNLGREGRREGGRSWSCWRFGGSHSVCSFDAVERGDGSAGYSMKGFNRCSVLLRRGCDQCCVARSFSRVYFFIYFSSPSG
jgi:hypothetical protein